MSFIDHQKPPLLSHKVLPEPINMLTVRGWSQPEGWGIWAEGEGEGEGRESQADWVATAKDIYGPYSARYPAILNGGHNVYFKDREGKWWSTIFNGPISEKPGILPIDIRSNGQIALRDG